MYVRVRYEYGYTNDKLRLAEVPRNKRCIVCPITGLHTGRKLTMEPSIPTSSASPTFENETCPKYEYISLMLVRLATCPEGLGSQQPSSSLVFGAHDQLVLVIVTLKRGKLGWKRLSPATRSRCCPLLVHMYDMACSLHLKNKIRCFCLCLPCLDALVRKVINHFPIFVCLEK